MDKVTKLTLIYILGFVLYCIAACVAVALWRLYVENVPVFHRTTLELIDRASLLVFYLFWVNLPAFILHSWNKSAKESAVVFGACLPVLLMFINTIFVIFAIYIVMVPLFVVGYSWYVFGVACVDMPRRFKHFMSLNNKFTNGLKILVNFVLGVGIGIAYVVACIWLQFVAFDRYDFTGRNYGIPSHKQAIFQDLGF